MQRATRRGGPSLGVWSPPQRTGLRQPTAAYGPSEPQREPIAVPVVAVPAPCCSLTSAGEESPEGDHRDHVVVGVRRARGPSGALYLDC